MDAEQLIEALGEWPHESRRAFRALVDYATMDGRSLRKLLSRYREQPESAPTRRATTLEKWSAKYGWQERVAKWDRESAILAAERWANREEKLRETKWEDGDLLRKVSREELINYRLMQSSGQPTKITAGQAVKMLETASALQNAALGKPEKREQLDLTLPEEWERAFSDEYGGGNIGAEPDEEE